VTVARFMSLAAEGMGVRLRRMPVPWLAARAVVGLVTLAAPLFGATELRSSLAASLDFIARDNPFTSERARRELGWDPPVHPETGVPEAFRWWMQHR
jgi:nucleoside-diphosphate-sugar epimerase